MYKNSLFKILMLKYFFFFNSQQILIKIFLRIQITLYFQKVCIVFQIFRYALNNNLLSLLNFLSYDNGPFLLRFLFMLATFLNIWWVPYYGTHFQITTSNANRQMEVKTMVIQLGFYHLLQHLSLINVFLILLRFFMSCFTVIYIRTLKMKIEKK